MRRMRRSKSGTEATHVVHAEGVHDPGVVYSRVGQVQESVATRGWLFSALACYCISGCSMCVL